MRRLIGLFVLAWMLVACGGGEDALSLPAEAAEGSGEAVELIEEAVSPRPTERPTLPPTWTPMPAVQSVATPVLVGGRPAPGVVQVVHIVVEGETLGELAEQYGVSVADIARMNGIVDVDHIEVDWELAIPAP